MSTGFRAGASRKEITPPAGTSLGGFIARLGVSTGSAEPMHVRAVVMSLGNRALAVVTADVLGFAAKHVHSVRDFASDRLGLRKEDVLLSATHTHAGPSIILVRGCELVSEQYHDFFIRSMQAALDEAFHAQSPARLEIGSCPFTLGINRRQDTASGVVLGVAPEKPRPERLRVARIETSTQQIVLLTHACHPYVLGADVLLASGDFPSMACNALERDSRTVAMFLNGCGGDIAPLSAFQGVERAFAEGRRLAEVATSTFDGLDEILVDHLSGQNVTVRLPHAPLPTERDLDAIAAEAERVISAKERRQPEVLQKIRRAMDDWRQLAVRIARRELPLEPLYCEVQVLHLGSLALVGIAGEPFFALGEQVRREATDPNTWLLGYTNTYCGYLPTVDEYPLGGYEVNDAWKYVGTWKVEEASAPLVVDAARAILIAR
jgi:neutral ceramidase